MGGVPIRPGLRASCQAEGSELGAGAVPAHPSRAACSVLTPRCGCRPRPHTEASSIVWLRLTATSRWVSHFSGASAGGRPRGFSSGFLLPRWGCAPGKEETKGGGSWGWEVAQDGAEILPSLSQGTLPEWEGQRGGPPGPKVALSFCSFWAFSRA